MSNIGKIRQGDSKEYLFNLNTKVNVDLELGAEKLKKFLYFNSKSDSMGFKFEKPTVLISNMEQCEFGIISGSDLSGPWFNIHFDSLDELEKFIKNCYDIVKKLKKGV